MLEDSSRKSRTTHCPSTASLWKCMNSGDPTCRGSALPRFVCRQRGYVRHTSCSAIAGAGVAPAKPRGLVLWLTAAEKKVRSTRSLRNGDLLLELASPSAFAHGLVPDPALCLRFWTASERPSRSVYYSAMISWAPYSISFPFERRFSSRRDPPSAHLRLRLPHWCAFGRRKIRFRILLGLPKEESPRRLPAHDGNPETLQ